MKYEGIKRHLLKIFALKVLVLVINLLPMNSLLSPLAILADALNATVQLHIHRGLNGFTGNLICKEAKTRLFSHK